MRSRRSVKLPGTPAAASLDVDGTLVDSVAYEAAAWLEAIRTVEPAMTLERVTKQIGKGADHLLPALLPPAVVRSHHERLEKLQGTIFHERYRSLVRPFAGVRALFGKLRAAGVTIALVSSGDRADIEYYELLTGIRGLVDFIVCADDVDRSKPSPDLFRAALGRLDAVAPERIVAVGDSPYDAEAAAQVAIATIGVTCGGAFGRQELVDAGCVAVCDGPADVIGLLGLVSV